VAWRPVRGGRQHRAHAQLPKLFTRNQVVCFLEVHKAVKTSLAYSQISQNLAGERNAVCITTAGTKTALGIIQIWFNYFAASHFKALGNVKVNYLKIPKKHRGPNKIPSRATCGPRVWGPYSTPMFSMYNMLLLIHNIYSV